MSSEWSGFTDEDLKQIRGRCSPDLAGPRTTSNEDLHGLPSPTSFENPLNSEERKSAFQKKATMKNKGGILKIKSQNQNGNSEIPLTPEQSLSSSLSPTAGLSGSLKQSGNIAVLKVDSVSQTFEVLGNNLDSVSEESQLLKNEDIFNNVALPMEAIALSEEDSVIGDNLSAACTCVSPKYNEHELSLVSNKSLEKVALERFEEKRKQMEAENDKRKRMLLEALDDRKKRTREEAKKIAKIQTELNKLDSMLSCDVGILRNQIEVASLEFTSAQKRYEKAEKEFVEAKFALFQKLERKEQLTDYLCTIIEQNEARKANKLSELMKQLELDSLLENNQKLETPSHPCLLNGMTMSHCSVTATSQVPFVNTVTCAENADEYSPTPD